jgi:hypothetical protein
MVAVFQGSCLKTGCTAAADLKSAEDYLTKKCKGQPGWENLTTSGGGAKAATAPKASGKGKGAMF